MEHAIRPIVSAPRSAGAMTAGAGDFIRKSWYVLGKMPEIRGRLRQIDRLWAMSDAELARRGLRREDIVAEVFLRRDFF